MQLHWERDTKKANAIAQRGNAPYQNHIHNVMQNCARYNHDYMATIEPNNIFILNQTFEKEKKNNCGDNCAPHINIFNLMQRGSQPEENKCSNTVPKDFIYLF